MSSRCRDECTQPGDGAAELGVESHSMSTQVKSRYMTLIGKLRHSNLEGCRFRSTLLRRIGRMLTGDCMEELEDWVAGGGKLAKRQKR